MGETANIASRLQDLAERNRIVVGPGTYELSRGRFNFVDLGEQVIKGLSEPIRMREVISKSAAESRFDLSRDRGLTPLVGPRR